jgi:putative nucleotidyltransferase with HDIG domain
MNDVIEQVHSLPALPRNAVEILRMLHNPEVSMSRLAEHVSIDQGLAANFLKMANSAFYGFPRQVSTVREATLLLGLKTVRCLVLAATSRSLMCHPVVGYDLAAGALWQHSLAVAIGARLLAERSGYRAGEEAFMAGLLHDVGKIILGQFVNGHLADIREHLRSQGTTFIAAEQAVLGFDHAHIGARAAEKWLLPLELVGAIAYHEQPAHARTSRHLVDLVHLANVLVRGLGFGTNPDEQPYPHDVAAAHRLNLTAATLDEVAGLIPSALAQFEA